MYLKKFCEAASENRPSCVHYDVLPKGTIGKLAAGVVDVDPGGESLSDPHTQWHQVFFILDGTGRLILTDPEGVSTEIRLEPDTVVEIPYNHNHTLIADPDVPMRYLYVNDYSLGATDRS